MRNRFHNVALTFNRTAIATAIVCATPALAQETLPEPEDEPGPPAVTESDVIIITGTAGGGIRRQDAAFAITTVDNEAIDRISPTSTADLFKAVPGVTAESSGGQNGANIFVRGFPSGGDAEFVTLQTEGVPFFPPSTLSFLENTQLIRIDETLARIEAVRGGTGALFSSGQPGLTINFVQRKGGAEFEGLAKATVTDYGDLRGDALVAGPVGPNTSVLIGGFYRQGSGIRDPEFDAEKGGQVTANITHDFDNGSVLVFGRYLDDRGQWLLPIPVVQESEDEIDEFPGFDAGTGTFASDELRRLTLPDGSEFDLADGRGAQIGQVGLNVEFEIAPGLSVRDRASWLQGDANTTGLVPGGTPPLTAAAYAESLDGAIGSLSFVEGGGAVPDAASQLVVPVGAWIVEKEIQALVNDFAVEWRQDRNTLTAGIFITDYSSRDRWNLGNLQLLTAEENARRLDLVLADGRQATQNGFLGGSFFNVNADYEGTDLALYLVDELQITPELRIDGGIRWQQHEVNGTLENNTFGVDLDDNPDTLFNNGVAVLNGTFSTIDFKGDEFSWTAGANYDFTPDLGLFLRYSRGHTFPSFDALRDGLRLTQQIDSYEGGLKVSLDFVSLYGTVFYNEFEGLATTQITSGAPIPAVGGAETTGVEVEGALRPFEGLSLGFALTYLDAKYVDFFSGGGTIDNSGNQVQRQPEWQWRISPAYETPLGGFGDLGLFATLSYVGDRFSDVENQQLLPNYYKLDAGISLRVAERLEFQVTADNLTDEIGLTEGNPRLIGDQGSGVILARPILGRSFSFSATYTF